MDLQPVSILAMIALTSIATYVDLKERRIPNALTVSAALGGVAWGAYSGGLAGLLASIGGFAVGFGILLALWLIGGGGGGDVKLMGAVGAWLGPLPTLIVFLGSTLFAIICTLVLMVWNASASHQGGHPTVLSQDDANEPPVAKQSIPYALPVALSIWSLIVFQTIR
ncbi:A24 family peptidase [Roseiconus lacunae]|uniref:A24 family peptidase n=1 Tax=Roseiconus lacunae TaxID=2605694 RepID=A0ABT7PL40_9BACT|nr:A24 family peptidase [Roseiconus lacunae]MCD0462702.1 A24 family peptidase [Roseiconus lacunae]MDM4017211.1 A24 family peptidase [Roseiconus lacunae]